MLNQDFFIKVNIKISKPLNLGLKNLILHLMNYLKNVNKKLLILKKTHFPFTRLLKHYNKKIKTLDFLFFDSIIILLNFVIIVLGVLK